MSEATISIARRLLSSEDSVHSRGRATSLIILIDRCLARRPHDPLLLDWTDGEREMSAWSIAKRISESSRLPFVEEPFSEDAHWAARECAMVIRNTFVTGWCDEVLSENATFADIVEPLVRAGRLPANDDSARWARALVAGGIEFVVRLHALIEPQYADPQVRPDEMRALWLLPFYDSLVAFFRIKGESSWATLLTRSLSVHRRLDIEVNLSQLVSDLEAATLICEWLIAG